LTFAQQPEESMLMNFGILFMTLNGMWVASEILLIVLSRSKSSGRDYDDGSLKWLNIIIYSCVALAVSVGFLGIGRLHASGSLIPWAGLYIIAFGLIVRWSAIMKLRNFFTVNVVIQSDHRIIKTGIYKFVRHPSYSGALISFFGLGLAFSNWISIVLLVVPVAVAFLKRIQIEEQALKSAFGEEYIKYRKTTWALFPWVY